MNFSLLFRRLFLLEGKKKKSFRTLFEKWWRVRDSNPWVHAWKACELTVSPTSHMALEVGLEPTTDRLTADCSTNWAIQAYSIKWSGWWESNPRSQLGRLKFYHWTTPALNGAQGRSRTGTDFKVRRILSPVRLPISPSGQPWGFELCTCFSSLSRISKNIFLSWL